MPATLEKITCLVKWQDASFVGEPGGSKWSIARLGRRWPPPDASEDVQEVCIGMLVLIARVQHRLLRYP